MAELARKPERDQARQLPDLLPAIRACVRRGGPSVAAAAKAWLIEPGRAAARLWGPAGERFDCGAPTDGQPGERLDAVPSEAPSLPGEDRPLFLPALGSALEPPRALRQGLQVLVDADGSVLGWLTYDGAQGKAAAPGDRP